MKQPGLLLGFSILIWWLPVGWGVNARRWMTGTLESTLVHCENVEILLDFEYNTVSDNLSHLGGYSSKAEGRIQDVSVSSH
jgi:hypothetical protein